MTPSARVAAAIQLLDIIIDSARDGGAAADTLAQRYFKDRRYAGSGDRRAIREWVWEAIRRFGERPAAGRDAMIALADADPALAALFDGSGHGPSPIYPRETRATGGPLPLWLMPFLDARVASDPAELAALLMRAPVDIRINRDRAGDVELPTGEPLPLPLDGVRLPSDTPVVDSAAWRVGAIEVQDAGSQWISLACDVKPGMIVVDLCAGAGGKTLALAAAMQGEGRLIACDTARARLQNLPQRASRAGAGWIETRLLDAGKEKQQLADLVGKADVVLVDAPCSGSGTWRRNPEARWRLTPERLEKLRATQQHVLDLAAPLVAARGALVYATCSIIRDEGEGQVAAMLYRHKRFTAAPLLADGATLPGRVAGAGRLLTPHHDQTDGFHVARLAAG
jgi:16S rRNA (cytosine967-C5)-methyltransferase